MTHQIVLSGHGTKYVLQLIASTLKSLRVWNVRFQDGAEAVLFKCGSEWMQRNEDNLDHWLIKAIGEKIDQINPQISFS
ncbi:hypothetical protein [Daejeonella lutea]|nr:hypothetical protein [Daejeonella lutea]